MEPLQIAVFALLVAILGIEIYRVFGKTGDSSRDSLVLMQQQLQTYGVSAGLL